MPMVIIKIIFIIWLSIINQISAKSYSYSVEKSKIFEGKLLNSSIVDSLSSCTSDCTRTNDCDGFNFVIDSQKQTHCLLIDSKQQPSAEIKQLLAKNILFSGSKILIEHQDFTCSHRSFAFEKWPNRRPSNPDDIIDKLHCSIEKCWNNCLKRKGCLSIAYGASSNLCLLSSISVNFVYNIRKSYYYDDDFDVYENNCISVPISDSSCTWLRVKSGGIPDMYDSKLKAHNTEHCEQHCIQRSQNADICRSYTYDNWSKLCFLSSISSRLMGRSPLEFHNKNYTHGDLDDCMDLKLNCRIENLEVEGWTLRQFSGHLKTKRSRDVLCQSIISKQFHFKSKFEYDKCGLNKVNEPYAAYHGIVHLKEGSTSLVTIRDKVLQVQCRIHPQVERSQQVLSVSMNVTDPGNTRVLSDNVIILPKVVERSDPKFSLSVLSENGKTADKIRIGDKAWLRIRMNSKTSHHGHFLVTRVIAKDTKNNKSLELIDNDGCVSVNKTIIDYIHINSTTSEVSYRLNVGAFNQESELVYQAYVMPCESKCQPECNIDLLNEDKKTLIKTPSIAIVHRQRKSITPRQIELSQDIYKVYGSKLLVLPNEDQSSHVHDQSNVVEKISYNSLEFSIQRCFVDDVTCLFTTLLGLIQLFLFVACFISMYCYFLQWRRFRAAQTAMNPRNQIQIQHTLK